MNLVTRSAWGAKPFTCSNPLPKIDTVVVHYTAANSDEQADHANCAGRVRAIQRFHMSPSASDPSKPWCDIAYNFLVCKHGFVFEGRGWARKSGATGAANSHSIAVCFLGDDTKDRDDVTDAGRKALGEWIRAARAKLNPRAAVKGHRDFMATACPGDELYAWIQSGGWRPPRPVYDLYAGGKRRITGAKTLQAILEQRARLARLLRQFGGFRIRRRLP